MLDSGQLEASLDRLRVGPPPPIHHLLYAEDPRLKYRQQEPKITIMKRPGSAGPANGIQRQPKVEQKSLKQREQEYAEARHRILGVPEGPPEQQPGKAPTVLQANGKGPAVLQANPKTPQHHKKGKEGGIAAHRAPRGPPQDGSRGFHVQQPPARR